MKRVVFSAVVVFSLLVFRDPRFLCNSQRHLGSRRCIGRSSSRPGSLERQLRLEANLSRLRPLGQVQGCEGRGFNRGRTHGSRVLEGLFRWHGLDDEDSERDQIRRWDPSRCQGGQIFLRQGLKKLERDLQTISDQSKRSMSWTTPRSRLR